MSRSPSEVRPLTSRALKSAIDSLRPWLAGARVADLYAGSGRFGLDAQKESAAAVTFVEKDGRRTAEIRKSAENRGGAIEVFSQDVKHFLEQCAAQSRKFDVIFADPPFPLWKEKYGEELLSLVSAIMEEDSIFLVKHPQRMIVSGSPALPLRPWKTAKFGESGLTYFEYATQHK